MINLTTEGLLSGAIRRRLVRSILIKDDKAFAALERELKTALSVAWSKQMRAGIISALDRLRELGPGDFTKADAASIMAALEERVGAEALRAAMREPVLNLSDALFRTGASEVGRATGADIAFMRPDLDALDALKNNNLFWVGETWNSHTKDKIDAILTDYFEKGLTRDQLAARLADDFRSLTGKGDVYWSAVADHMATKGREIGRVTGYQRAGIRQVQIRAHIDTRTTICCRQLHGRVLTVAHLAEQRDAYFAACARGNVKEAKRLWVMHGREDDLSTTPTHDLKGVGSPPYHHRCRTITVAYWGGPAPIDDLRQRVFDRVTLSGGDKKEAVCIAKSAKWLSRRGALSKWNKHRGNIPTVKMAEYEKDARALIADPEATVILSTRIPHSRKDSGDVSLHAVFLRPQKRKNDGEPGYLATAVDLEDDQILTHHWRRNMTSEEDVTPGLILKAAGIFGRVKAWLFG